MIRSAMALMVWVALAATAAEAGVILPVTSSPGAPAVTLTLMQGTNDVTDTWMPEVTIAADGTVAGVPVTLNVTGLSNVSITLRTTAGTDGRNTTAHPGTCTNYSAPRNTNGESTDRFASSTGGGAKPDFADIPPGGNVLTPLDCGGTAVLDVTGSSGGSMFTVTFIVPRSDDGDLHPDICQAFGTLSADPDQDGFATGDECVRGFIFSRKHIRTDPAVKDVALHIVNAQASSNSLTLPAGDSLIGKPADATTRKIYPTDGTRIDANLAVLQSAVNVHLIGHPRDPSGNLVFDGLNRNTTEMVDRLVSFSVVSLRETFVYLLDDLVTSVTVTNQNLLATPTMDRVVTQNRVYGSSDKRAVRCIESLDVSATKPLGSAIHGTPSDNGECVIYTKRTVNSINTTSPTTETRIFYSTFDGTVWTPYTDKYNVVGGASNLTIDRDYIITKELQRIFAMELSHRIFLTEVATSIGFHDVVGTGGNLDERSQVITKGSPSGLKFKIPRIHLPSHLSSVNLGP